MGGDPTCRVGIEKPGEVLAELRKRGKDVMGRLTTTGEI
jgi:hypothetical protein